jgi:hypothetical protein
MEGERGEEDEGLEVSSGITKRRDRKKGHKEGGGGKDEWAKGILGKGRAGEGEGRGGGKVTGIKEMDDWEKAMFGKDGGSGRVRKEIAKEDVASMKGAWDEEVENQRGKEVGKESRVTDGELQSSEVRETHPLKIILGKVEKEDVESLPGVVDGDRVLIIPKGNYSRRGIKDGRHWLRGITTSLKTRGGEAVRNWRCGGGWRCKEETCRYKVQTRKENDTDFEMRGALRKWYCFECNIEAVAFREVCSAIKWTKTNEGEVAYCHKGKHNHPLGVVENKENADRWQMQVVSMARTDGALTPSRARQRIVTGELMEWMRNPTRETMHR